jgi:hypothetical protein
MSRLPAIVALAALASCGRPPQSAGGPSPAQPLAGLLTQQLALVPMGHVRGDSLGWVQRAGGARSMARQLDSTIAAVLADRGIGRTWLLPAELMRSYERNRSYATNPYELSIEPLRSAALQVPNRYGEPLASQLRTLIALHESARMVMVPVELRFERVGATAARGVLRAVMLDARVAETRWVSEIRGDTSSVASRAIGSLANRFADLFMAP